MLNYQTTKQWITLLVFCPSLHSWKVLCCGQTSQLLQGLKAPTFLLIICSEFATTLGKIWYKSTNSCSPRCDPTHFLKQDHYPSGLADVYTSVLFVKAFDTLLHDVLIWKARYFRSGLPLISTENSMKLGVQSSQETGKEKKKTSHHLLHSTSLRKKR